VDDKAVVFRRISSGLKTHDLRVKEWIYKLYWGYLMAIGIRYLGDRDMAMEVVNDSFIKAFKNLAAFNFNEDPEIAEKTFRSWLAKITVRTSLDRLRANRTHLNYVEEYQDIKDPAMEVDGKLHTDDILKLLEALPFLHRTVFNLYEIEGFSHDEVAAMLQIPSSSSRTYLTRAKSKLRELYKINMESYQ
jgi:RNA polymerase sigma factor (sigma-70 family)